MWAGRIRDGGVRGGTQVISSEMEQVIRERSRGGNEDFRCQAARMNFETQFFTVLRWRAFLVSLSTFYFFFRLAQSNKDVSGKHLLKSPMTVM